MKAIERKKLFNRDIGSREWLGEVIDTDDPLKMLRCKIRVYGLFNGLEDDQLPWAFPASSLTFSSTNGGFGSFSVPKKGTILKVRFNSGDIYAPEYYAIQNINETLRQELSEEYENSHVLLFDEDEDLRVLYTQKQGLVLKLKDTLINVKNDNSIFINNPNGDIIELTNGGKLTIKTSNNINVDTAKDVVVKCKNATVDAATSIKLGTGATEALIKGNTFQKLFNAHTHIGNLGAPTGIPIITLNGSELSTLSKTK